MIMAASVALLGCHKKELAQLKALQAAADSAQVNLVKFDDLDFNVFTGQKWEQLGKSHAQNVVVHWPDGYTSNGLEQHTEDLKAMFVWAPDTRITEHPIKIANGEWTAVMGVMEGTFTQPMPTDDGKNIAPTGKVFRVEMATLAHWRNGLMDEEYLFWDNQALLEQIGVGEKPEGSYGDPFPEDK
jgi:hypothetical protein